MDNAFKKRLVKKTYYALCEGKPNFHKITIDKPLKKVDLNPKKGGPIAKQTIDEKGESAITHVRLLNMINEKYCVIEANPVSGRMHQIRCHLAHIDLPIVGDKLYGATTVCAPIPLPYALPHCPCPCPKASGWNSTRELFLILVTICHKNQHTISVSKAVITKHR